MRSGFAGFYDYGPLGVEMKNNIKKIWWRDMVHRRDDMVYIRRPHKPQTQLHPFSHTHTHTTHSIQLLPCLELSCILFLDGDDE